MKHVMFVTNFLPHVGGLEYYVDDLSKTLKKYWNDDVHIVCFDTSEAMFETHGFYTVHRIKRLASVAGVFAIPSPSSLFRVLKGLHGTIGRPDLVWTHTRFFVSALVGLLFAKLFRLKTLHVEHGSSYVAHSNPVIRLCSRIWDQCFGRCVLTFSDHVAVVSPSGMPFASSLGAQKPNFVPAGIDAELWRPTADFFEIPERPKLLFVGRLLPGKGVELLLKAIQGEEFQHCTLQIAGDGPSRAALEAMCSELGVADRVEFLGTVPRSALPELYRRAALFVNPSFSEGGPLTVLEALASGTAVVTTRVGCVEHYLAASGGHGIITENISAESIRSGILAALQNFKKQNRKKCSEQIEGAFSWRHTARTLREATLQRPAEALVNPLGLES